MAFLELLDLRKVFGKTVAVDDFNLKVERGEFVSFLGPSGCGKTTTMRMIAGFETPTSGTVRLNDIDITYKPENKRDVGMVFQSYALFPHLSVRDNIGFGLKLAHKTKAEIRERVEEMLSLIKMQQLGDRYPHQLSGGQQQRVALARAVAFRPQVLLLDEPLSALDAKIRVSLRNEIRAIQRHLGITTIYVTHDQEEALSLSDRVVVMNEGQMEQVGTPFEIYNFPKTSFVASFVGTLNSLPAEVIDAHSGQLRVIGQVVFTTQQVNKSGAVRLALRPEQLRLHGNSENENSLPGTVDTISFLGSIVRVNIRVGDSILALDEFNHPSLTLPKLGESVMVYFPRSACMVLEG